MDNTEKVLEVYISWFTRHKTCQTTSLASCRVSCFSFFSFPSRILVGHPLPVTAAFGLEKAAESPIPGFLALRAGGLVVLVEEVIWAFFWRTGNRHRRKGWLCRASQGKTHLLAGGLPSLLSSLLLAFILLLRFLLQVIWGVSSMGRVVGGVAYLDLVISH